MRVARLMKQVLTPPGVKSGIAVARERARPPYMLVEISRAERVGDQMAYANSTGILDVGALVTIFAATIDEVATLQARVLAHCTGSDAEPSAAERQADPALGVLVAASLYVDNEEDSGWDGEMKLWRCDIAVSAMVAFP